MRSSSNDLSADVGPPVRAATSTRALLLGFALAVAHVIALVALEEYWGPAQPSRLTLVSTILFMFFWLVVLNGRLRRVRPRQALSQGELLVIFSMISVGSAIAGSDMVPVLVHILVEGTHAANEVNDYATRVLPYVPSWIHVSDPTAVKLFYEGHSSLFDSNHARLFLGPFLRWSAFIVCFLLMCFSANAIVRRQWSRSEHLNFPITQLPVAMSQQGSGGLFSNRLFWTGFGIAAGITLLNGVHALVPAVPALPTSGFLDMRYWVKNRVWDAMDWTPITFYPFAVGMAFLVPLDLLFSLWFFTWVWKFERIVATALGVPGISPWPLAQGFPHYAHQMIGVWLTLLAISLWTGRSHFRAVLQQSLRPGTGVDDAHEAISYRGALIGLAVGLIGVLGFLLSLGITAAMVVPYGILLLAFCVVIARIRAELGPPVQDMMGAGPDRAVMSFFSPMVVGPRSWITFRTMTFWLHRDASTTYPSAAHIDALRMGEIGGGLNRRFWAALLLVAVTGGLLAFWLDAYFGFMKPITRWKNFPGWCGAFCVWQEVGATVQDSSPRPNWSEVGAVLIGAAITFGLFLARGLGVSMPLHPIAYLLTAGMALPHFWVPILLAWATKLFVLRYGGLKLYRRALPFFFGLILGQFLIGIGWQIVGIVFGIKTYVFYS